MKMKKLVSLGLGAAMVFSMPFGASAEDGNVNVHGSIELGDDPTQIDVTIPTSVSWFVDDVSRPYIKNGTSSSNQQGDNPNEIINNTANDIIVTFKSFDQVLSNNTHAQDIEDDLNLLFTGDFAVGALDNQNLSKGWSTPQDIDILVGEGSLSFGFTGEYTGLITSSITYAPEYTMTLGFAFAG